MSRSQDLVGIATGDVRVSVESLSASKRLRLFDALAIVVRRHYEDLAGGSNFVTWQEENFGEEMTDNSIRKYSLALDKSLYPQHKNYNTKTRIVTLTGDYFRLPEFKLPKDGDWKLGDTKLVTRLCLTQNGDLYLEYYLGKVRMMDEQYPTIPRRVVVDEARYIEISRSIEIEKAPDELKALFIKAPEIIYSFGFACMRLFKNEEEARRRRADRDAKAFTDIANIGRIFGIRYP